MAYKYEEVEPRDRLQSLQHTLYINVITRIIRGLDDEVFCMLADINTTEMKLPKTSIQIIHKVIQCMQLKDINDESKLLDTINLIDGDFCFDSVDKLDEETLKKLQQLVIEITKLANQRRQRIENAKRTYSKLYRYCICARRRLAEKTVFGNRYLFSLCAIIGLILILGLSVNLFNAKSSQSWFR